MRKQRAPLRDFFSEYNHTKTRSTILSLMFAFLLSVSAVMITQDVDTRGLMASVSQIAGEKQYEADVVLESQADDTLSVVFGSLAQSVDSLSFTLLADPEKFTSLTTDNASAKIDNREPGMYVVTMKFNGENIYPGTKVISLKLPKVMSIALVDTTFQSAGLTYNLTSKGK